MAERNEQVMEMVKGELDKDPSAPLDALYARAVEIDPAVRELSMRQFHARYPLQVKRSRSAGQPRKRRGAAKKRGGARGAGKQEQGAAARQPRRVTVEGDDRGKLRALFLEFASDFAAAESRSEIVRMISNVDAYVERALKISFR